MACKCSKKKKSKYLKRRLFEIKQFKTMMSIKRKLPSTLNNKQLLDYHKKTHMLYTGNIKRKPVNKAFVNSIVDLHDKFVSEIQSRRMNHKTPLKKI